MRTNIVTSNIRDELLVAILFDIENQAYFLALLVAVESLASEKEAQLQRHVESRQAMNSIETHFRDVMNAELAVLNDAFDLG